MGGEPPILDGWHGDSSRMYLVGDVLETAIEGVLTRSGVIHRKTKRHKRARG